VTGSPDISLPILRLTPDEAEVLRRIYIRGDKQPALSQQDLQQKLRWSLARVQRAVHQLRTMDPQMVRASGSPARYVLTAAGKGAAIATYGS
jgi:Trp operon repressor